MRRDINFPEDLANEIKKQAKKNKNSFRVEVLQILNDNVPTKKGRTLHKEVRTA